MKIYNKADIPADMLHYFELATPGIGLEPTLGEWLDNIVAVGREVWRVLRDDGTLLLNLGDAYVGSPPRVGFGDQAFNGVHEKGRKANNVQGLKQKNLMGQPWRAAFALQDNGWILRSAIVWHKPNSMPESVRDRPTNAYEMVFLFSKQGKYFYDAESVRQPHSRDWWAEPGVPDYAPPGQSPHTGTRVSAKGKQPTTGANLRNVWTIPTQGRPDAHFATYPDELPRRCILAGTSEYGVCADCRAPWVRVVDKTFVRGTNAYPTPVRDRADGNSQGDNRNRDGHMGGGAHYETQTLGWQPTCECNAGRCEIHGKKDPHVAQHDGYTETAYPEGSNANRIAKLRQAARERGGEYQQSKTTVGWEPTCTCEANRIPATVLDVFVGSGTTCAVAQQLGRHSIGVDLNPEYLEIARKRIGGVSLPLF